MMEKSHFLVVALIAISCYQGLFCIEQEVMCSKLDDAVSYVKSLELKPERCLILCDIEQTLLFCSTRSKEHAAEKNQLTEEAMLQAQSDAIKQANRWYTDWINQGNYTLEATEGAKTAEAVRALRSLGDVVFITPRAVGCHQKTIEHLQKLGISMPSCTQEKATIFSGGTYTIPDDIVVMHDTQIIYCANASKEQAVGRYLSCCGKEYGAVVIIDDRINELEEACLGSQTIKYQYPIWYNPFNYKKDTKMKRHTVDSINVLKEVVAEAAKDNKRVLALVDLDHTVVRLKDESPDSLGGYIGAERFYKRLREEGMEDFPARQATMDAYIQKIKEGVEQVPVEDSQTIATINDISSLSTVLFFTGRPAQVHEETLALLKQHNLLPTAVPLFPEGAVWTGEGIVGSAHATVENIVYTNMSNKGVVFKRMLEHLAPLFDVVVFIDDSEPHVTSVQEVLLAEENCAIKEYIGITYTRMHSVRHGVESRWE